MTAAPIDADLAATLERIEPQLREFRHDLHRYPELGFEEHRTGRRVRQWLEALGIEARACAETGLVADLRPDLRASGPTLALRADLDALPIHESTELPHRSEYPGRSHKCGHDGHTTILVGVATALMQRRERLSHNIRLLFQPAEEGVRGGGARVMIEQGALEGVREIYGLHNWPAFAKGEVHVVSGATMAAIDSVDLDVHGVGGHASTPQHCRDPIVAAAQWLASAQTITSRGTDVHGGAVLTIGAIQGGQARNVIPDHVELRGTLRTLSPSLRAELVRRLERITSGTAQAHDLRMVLGVHEEYPVLVNDAACAEAVRRVACNLVGVDRVSADGLPLGASEDFSFFTQQCAGAYFFLGAGRAGEATPGCHHPDFDFDDDLLSLGIHMMVGICEDRLQAWSHAS